MCIIRSFINIEIGKESRSYGYKLKNKDLGDSTFKHN